MGSPVRIGHGKIHACIMAWLGNYWTATPGVQVADNTTVRLDGDNEPQPDALLRIEKRAIANSFRWLYRRIAGTNCRNCYSIFIRSMDRKIGFKPCR
jgi:hypothetical protein